MRLLLDECVPALERALLILAVGSYVRVESED